MTKIAVIYYSATGHVHRLADALAQGAVDGGAEVRLLRVPELAPEDVIRVQDAWQEQYVAARGPVREVKLKDLEWADGFAFGTPTRYGLPAAQLKAFIDQTGPLWKNGALANKVATSFTSSANQHGGQESTLLALNNVFYHWGSLIVPPGYTHRVQYAAGGNPYGTSYSSGLEGDPSVTADALTAAHYQGYRLAQYATLLVLGRLSASSPPNGSPSTSKHEGDASSDLARPAVRPRPIPLDPDAYSPPNPARWAGQAMSASP